MQLKSQLSVVVVVALKKQHICCEGVCFTLVCLNSVCVKSYLTSRLSDFDFVFTFIRKH